MKTLDKGVCAPKGFHAAAVAAGIKKPDATRLDCAMIASDAPAAVAGVFTTNLVQAAPVRYCREACERGVARAIVANSGNANACTGDQGYADVLATAALAGRLIDAPPEQVCVCSTGVIGVPMPMDRLLRGVEQCAAKLSDQNGGDAARAIMTTDTVPKEIAAEIPLGAGAVRIGAIAKGAGMIAPNMATMLCFITTDVAVDADNLQSLLQKAVAISFNCICVDNDMSTNDTALCLANGRSGVSLLPGTVDFERFGDALNEICLSLAQALVRDGEGATKFIAIIVSGAATDADAKRIAASVAKSQLCKTAFYGQDANWGRIAAAAGYSGARFDPAGLDLHIQGVHVLAQGQPTAYSEADVQALMKAPEIEVRISLREGAGAATFWTSDLSLDYIKINADYRT
ncbi:MAG TPA: bifunctional glutamate N-acetyltransferase/amino-acid acetyltransferase ArgJ [Candidatus Hydrogenedentes bacterium]|nr:bifunctional glutamate N-acetyltransferase/amino-acid acetyltransferase ArgJ [Candidatus Hydrogenedentota bacterium]